MGNSNLGDLADSTAADEILLRGLIGGDAAAAEAIITHMGSTSSVAVLVAGGVLTRDTAPLARAADLASTARDRQLVVLGRTHLEGPADLFDALVRDHLASYPDHLVAAWLAGHRL